MISAQRRGCARGGGVPTLPSFICWGGTLVSGHNLQLVSGHLAFLLSSLQRPAWLWEAAPLIWGGRWGGSPISP